MPTLRSCLKKIKAAGFDTDSIDTKAMVAAGEENMFEYIDSVVDPLNIEHSDLNAARNRLMAKAAQASPEVAAAVQEHHDDETALNAPERQGPRQPTPGLKSGIAAQNVAGLPKKARAQKPKSPENLEAAIESKKVTATEELTKAVAKTLKVLRRAQRDNKEYHELSPTYAVRKAKEAGKMEEIRAQFPEETSDIAAMKKFQAIARNQVAQEAKSDESPVFSKRQEKQLGAFNKEIIAQRSDEVVDDGARSEVDPRDLEGVTEVEPNSVEVKIEPHSTAAGSRKEVNGVVGIARRLKAFFPGSTFHREPAGNGLSTYVIQQEEAQPGQYDGSPQEMAAALVKAMVDGVRDPKNKIVLVDKNGKRVPFNAIGITKIGAVVDQATNDAKLDNVTKSGRQFNAGLAWLIDQGNFVPEEALDSKTVIDTRGTTIARAAKWIGFRQEGAAKAVERKAAERGVTKQELEVDPADIVQEAGQETDVNNESFEEQQIQIERSAGRVKTAPEVVGASIRPKETNPSNEEAKKIFTASIQRKALGNIPQNFVGLINKLFAQLGIKTKVIVVDRKGAKLLLKEPGLPVQWKTNLEAVLADKPAGRLMLSDSNNANERFAMVYVDTTQSAAKQQGALVHELGHIVQLAKLDQMPANIKEEMVKAYEGTKSQEEFEEWFADQLLPWVNSNKVAKGTLEKFFKDLARTLKKLYAKFTGVDKTYEQFMDTLVAAEQLKRGIQKPASGKYRKDWIDDMASSVDSPFLGQPERPFYNLGGPGTGGFNAGQTTNANKVLDWGKDAVQTARETAGEIITPVHQVVLQTSDAYLRNNGLAWLADHFHKQPNVGTESPGPSIEQEIRIEVGQFEPQMDKVMALIPKSKGFKGFVDKSSPVYTQAVSDLITETANPSPLAAQLRAYFVEMEKYLQDNGVILKKRKNYFPMILDTVTWNANHDKVVTIAMTKLGKTRAEAEDLFTAVSQDPNSAFDLQGMYDPRTAGSFGHAKSRAFGPKEHEAFIDFIDTDLVSVVKNYTHSAVKHVIVQQHFGKPGTQQGQSDPLINLKTQLTKALIAGEITKDVYDRTWNVIIPGVFGQLGSQMNPSLRKMQSGLVFFQNVRLLGTAVLSSLVDPVHVMYRSGTLRGQWAAIKKAIADMRSEEQQAFYRTIGIIRDDLTESITNDPVHTQFYAPGIRRLNELFFRANGMHTLTNFSRIYSYSAGKQFILEMANTNNTKRLKEMGLTRQQVFAWNKNGQGNNLESADPNDRAVLYALHQFVDESILRPSASMRPPWMSDQRWLLVANLKSFIFTYHETILRRVWSQVRAGEFKNPEVLLPFIAFGAIALATSMLGYETRRQIMNAGDIPPYARADAMDYLWEGAQRTGALGTMQFLVDSIEAENRGKMALMSLLGPTASQFEMLMTKDLSYSLPRSLPLFAQSPSLREWARDF